MTDHEFSDLEYPERSVVAILGTREAADVNIVGTGILIGKRTVLTAAHVVGSRPEAKYVRVFSQAAGILMVHKDDEDGLRSDGLDLPPDPERHGLFFAEPDNAQKGFQTHDDLVLIKLRHDHSGLEAPLSFSSPGDDAKISPGDDAKIIGVGGGHAGLVEKRTLKVKDGDEQGIFCLDDKDALGRLDSGSPVLTQEGGAVGVYIGGQSRKVIALESHQSWLESEKTRIESANPGRCEERQSWKLIRARKSGVLKLGHDKRLSIPVTVEEEAEADLLVVSVNAVGLPDQEYIPALRLRLFCGDKLVQVRDQPSQIQSIRYRKPKDGTWEVEISKDRLDFGYTRIQFAWSLFAKL